MYIQFFSQLLLMLYSEDIKKLPSIIFYSKVVVTTLSLIEVTRFTCNNFRIHVILHTYTLKKGGIENIFTSKCLELKCHISMIFLHVQSKIKNFIEADIISVNMERNNLQLFNIDRSYFYEVS